MVHAMDVGFTGRAGEVVIDDEYRLEGIRAAATAKQRAEASEGWLRKIAKKRRARLRRDRRPGHPRSRRQSLHAVAAAVIIAADELKTKLRKIDGMDDFEDHFARRRHPTVRLARTLHRFPLPGQRGPRSDDDCPRRRLGDGTLAAAAARPHPAVRRPEQLAHAANSMARASILSHIGHFSAHCSAFAKAPRALTRSASSWYAPSTIRLAAGADSDG